MGDAERLQSWRDDRQLNQFPEVRSGCTEPLASEYNRERHGYLVVISDNQPDDAYSEHPRHDDVCHCDSWTYGNDHSSGVLGSHFVNSIAVMCPDVSAQEVRAKTVLEHLMEHDPSTIDVVMAMRSRGRSWVRIRQCFQSVITGLDIE